MSGAHKKSLDPDRNCKKNAEAIKIAEKISKKFWGFIKKSDGPWKTIL